MRPPLSLVRINPGHRATGLLLALLTFFVLSGPAKGTVLPPGSSAPPDIFAGLPGATLLASLNSGFVTSSNGKVTFDLVAAVYADPTNVFAAGDLTFVYQVANSDTSVDAIARVTAIDFTGFLTDVGYTPVGATLPGGLFVDGTVPPQLVDRALSGDTVGFTFNAPVLLSILPGQTSNALIIQTNATNFKPGAFNIIDGGVSTVNVFGPAEGIPEPGSLTLLALGIGLMVLAGLSRTFKYC